MITEKMIKDAAKLLKKNLGKNDNRLKHLKSTAKTAKKLAKKFGEDENTAYFVGLVHDITKSYTKEKTIEILKSNNIQDDFLYEDYKIAHGLTAAYFICENFDLPIGGDIFNSIAYHTYGRSGMSKLEKILYLADFIEPNRDFDKIDLIRKEAQKNLNSATLMALTSSIEFLIKNSKKIHPNSIFMYNELIKNI